MTRESRIELLTSTLQLPRERCLAAQSPRSRSRSGLRVSWPCVLPEAGVGACRLFRVLAYLRYEEGVYRDVASVVMIDHKKIGWEGEMLARVAAGRLQDAGAWRIRWAMLGSLGSQTYEVRSSY